VSSSQLNIVFVFVYLNWRLEDNVEKGGEGSGAIWNFGMSIVRRSSVAGLKI
jgi:hypothetical protein